MNNIPYEYSYHSFTRYLRRHKIDCNVDISSIFMDNYILHHFLLINVACYFAGQTTTLKMTVLVSRDLMAH